MLRKTGILLCAALLAVSLAGCVTIGWDDGEWSGPWQEAVQPSGTVENRAYDLGDFDALSVGVNGTDVKVTLSPGESGVWIEADTAYLDALNVSVTSGGTLTINSGNDRVGDVSVSVSMSGLRAVNLSGAAELRGTGEFTGESLSVSASGSSSVGLTARYQRVDAQLSGASDLTMDGSADTLDLQLSGSSDADTLDTATKDVTIDASGACTARVNAENTLSVQASGSSDVEYTGAARVTLQSSGASTVTQRDN